MKVKQVRVPFKTEGAHEKEMTILLELETDVERIHFDQRIPYTVNNDESTDQTVAPAKVTLSGNCIRIEIDFASKYVERIL